MAKLAPQFAALLLAALASTALATEYVAECLCLVRGFPISLPNLVALVAAELFAE